MLGSLCRASIVALTWVCVSTAGAQSRAAPSVRETADLVLVNGRVHTVDPVRPFTTALAVRDGKILFVGSDTEARALVRAGTRVVDLGGMTVLPGLVDAHAHLLGLGRALRNVQLAGAESYDEVIRRVMQRAREVKAGEWIIGRGWDQNRWPVKEFPTHEALSRAVPSNPVVLTRIDGHALLANAAAMRIADVNASTKDPDGGRVLRLPDGSPSGVFIDNAKGLVERSIPRESREDRRRAILAAAAEANRWGLVGVHDAGESRAAIDELETIAREGRLTIRAYVMIADDSAAIAHYTARGPVMGLYDGRIWIRSIKLYADGALGSRGAALLEPYSDDPGNRGLLVSQPAHLQRVAELALRRGFQVNIHAIGDRGNRIALDAFAAALKTVPRADHRFRIEHAQVISPADIPRFAALGVIPSMQSSHQTSDMRWAEARLGRERVRGAYAWRSLLNTGVVIPNGTDFPIEEVSPFITFHSAVTRQDSSGWPAGGWYPAEKMTRDEALESMTIWPAFAAFQENVTGSLTPGKYADFVILDRDMMTVPETEILSTRVLATYLGGRVVYQVK